MILHLVIFLFACYAMASIIIDQKIFEEVRGWILQCSCSHPNWFTRKICLLLHCYFCTGFWCGLVITALLINPFGITFLDPLLGGLIGAEFSYRFHLFATATENWLQSTFNVEV